MKKINDWSWAYENPHTMYGKMMLNLKRHTIQDYKKNNNNYLALKECLGKEYIEKCSMEHYQKNFIVTKITMIL